MRLTAKLALASVVGLALTPVACGDDDVASKSNPTTSSTGGTGGGGGGGLPDGLFIEGLSASVDVAYDDHGIVHITCQTDEDCVATLGYVHAANRFFVMDFVRHAMRGTLGGIVAAGDAVLESDFFYRQFMSTAQGEPLEDAVVADMDAESLQLLERYAAGVNAWIDDVRMGRNGAALSTEYDFQLMNKDVIDDWEPQDSVAMGFYLMDLLANTVDEELTIGQMMADFPADLAADALRIAPPFADFTIPASGGTFPAAFPPPPPGPPSAGSSAKLAHAGALMRRARQRMTAARSLLHLPRDGALGSNNWVIAPERTSGGNAILSNDPHLGMNNPAVFFPVEVDSTTSGSGTLHVAGGSIPALPAVLIGHNETLAWGVTTANYDLNEVYLETLNDAGTAVMFNGSWVDIVTRDVTFANAAGDPVTKTLKWVPHHGPILEEDLTSKTAISVRWVLQEGMTDVKSFMGLNRAAAVSDLPAALADITATNQNFVAVDDQGNIGWYPYGRIPNRPWASLAQPSWAPVSGDGTAEWSGFIDKADLPQLSNPPAGFIATANQDITGASADGDPTNDGHPVLQALDTAPGARMHRIVQLIEDNGSAHDVATELGIQADTFSVIAEAIVPPLVQELGNLGLTGTAATAVTVLGNWQYTCPTGLASSDPEGAVDADATVAAEAAGCTAFHFLLYQLFDKMLGDEEDLYQVDFFTRMKTHLVITAITDPGQLATGASFFDDVSTGPVETREDILQAAIDQTATLLDARFGADPDTWRWGRIHTLTFRSIFDSFGLPTYNNGPFSNDGGLYTVDVASFKSVGSSMAQTHGATIRVVVEATPTGMQMKWQSAGGTSLDRESPFYDQFVEDYLKNAPIDFPFGAGAVPNPAIAQVFEPMP